ncbi:hypothetical protein [Actinobaculum sp. 352]|uniref:hypothetical protein n=1 Tax=Actinobaculum sp. 352 TaxID=2490946 RepID=UPI000F7DAACE|nr:hypothetical protein [Actinobaculum sp. 352]RTE47669.1 hypothetical protein EKN07_12280 [Actinobaculum sp. 352]
MSHQHWTGATLPDPTDGIIASIETMADTAGIITPASDIATARGILATAIAAGAPISTGRPAYFDIGGIIYRSDGADTGGVYALSPVNEVETTFDSFSGGVYQRTSGSQSALITSKLPARPYDRVVIAFGMADAAVSGIAGLRILIMDNSSPTTARWEDNAEMQTQNVFSMARIPAGVDPKVILAVNFGGATGKVSKVTFSGATDVNKLAVMAMPITMG